MPKLTRRGLIGSTGGLLGLAACSEDSLPASDRRITVSADDRPGYPGSCSFDHGVASGDPLSDRVILWTHVTPDQAFPDVSIPVSYGVFKDKAMTQPVAYNQGFALAARDYTIKVDVDGLEPGTEYFFRFEAKTVAGSVRSLHGRTKTTHLRGDAPVRFAIVSCANWPFGFFHVYDDIAKTTDLDAIIHLGDYYYEYGIGGYGATVGQAIGRTHEPPLEIITLGDYRLRHAQYKSDPALQAAHAAAPWLCTWDDHESANNSYRTGAQNHNPEANEGNWSDRKQAAIQAYLEWMPVRDPEPGRARESIYRRFDFGDVASVMCLDSRLTGRSDEISWAGTIAGLDPALVPDKAAETMAEVADPTRTMLGAVQEAWLGTQLAESVQSGKTWQVLANQVMLARVKLPDFHQTLTPQQISAQDNQRVRGLFDFSQLGLPTNLDAWDGFPAARDRLYDSAKTAGARLITLTGDTHTAWANTLRDSNGQQSGVEFGCSSVTSPGFGAYVQDVDDLGDQFSDANPEIDWNDPMNSGWTLVTLAKDEVKADYRKVSDVKIPTYSAADLASFVTQRTETSLTPLARVGD